MNIYLYIPIVTLVLPKVVKFKFTKLLQVSKKLSGILNCEFIVTLWRLLQSLKVSTPKDVTLEGIVALIKFSEEANAPFPIDVTDDGISIIRK